MKRFLVLAVFILVASAGDVLSQITLTYDAIITTSIGRHSSTFPTGEITLAADVRNQLGCS